MHNRWRAIRVRATAHERAVARQNLTRQVSEQNLPLERSASTGPPHCSRRRPSRASRRLSLRLSSARRRFASAFLAQSSQSPAYHW
jgi:hypothetical protein